MKRRDWFSFAFCAAAVLVSVLAIGGAPRWAQALVAALVAVGVGVTSPSRRKFEKRNPLLVLIGAAAVWTLIQILPLPRAIIHALSPTLETLRSDGATLAKVSPSSTLSMDPAATLRSLTFLVTLGGLAFVALRLAVSERGRFYLVSAVASTAALAALIAAIGKALGATKLYGLYEPTQLPPILGPLLNTNHLGALTAIGAITSGGLIMYPKQPAALRATWLLAGLLCVAITAATYSRGAVLALAAGLLVMLVTIIAQRLFATDREPSRRRRERFLSATLPIGVIVMCALVLTIYLGAGTVMSQLQTTSLDELHAPRTKYAAWVSAGELVRESPWVGTGRGAFESAFTRVHPASAYSTFSHPENETIQAIVEWGIPAAIVFGVLAGWTILLAVRRWRDGPLAAGALGAVTAIALQSNFDFGMELLGLAAPVIVLLATLTYRGLAEIPQRSRRSIAIRRAIFVTALTAGAALLLTNRTRTIAADHEALGERPTAALVAASIEAHPLDYLGFAVMAQQHERQGATDVVPLLNHALRLHPTHPGLHWIAARMLARTGRMSQAEAEYTTVVRYSPNPKDVIAELVTVLPPERAARAIPIDLSIENTLRYIRLDIARRWLERILDHSDNIRAAEALYSLGMRTKDWSMAESGARHRCRITPSEQCSLQLASVLKLAGKPEQVIATLSNVADWHGRREDRVAGWLMLCEAHKASGRLDEASDCVRRLEATDLQETPP